MHYDDLRPLPGKRLRSSSRDRRPCVAICRALPSVSDDIPRWRTPTLHPPRPGHLRDAEHLLTTSPGNARYLAGYVAECALKAVIEQSDPMLHAPAFGHQLTKLEGDGFDLAIALAPRTARYRPRAATVQGGIARSFTGIALICTGSRSSASSDMPPLVYVRSLTWSVIRVRGRSSRFVASAGPRRLGLTRPHRAGDGPACGHVYGRQPAKGRNLQVDSEPPRRCPASGLSSIVSRCAPYRGDVDAVATRWFARPDSDPGIARRRCPRGLASTRSGVGRGLSMGARGPPSSRRTACSGCGE